MVAAVAVDPLIFSVSAELLFFVRRQTLGVPVHFGSCGVAYLSGLDDDFVLGSVGRNGDLTKFALKHLKQPIS